MLWQECTWEQNTQEVNTDHCEPESISQVHGTPGMRLSGIADLSTDRALASLERTGFPRPKYDESLKLTLEDAIKTGKTAITTDSAKLIATPGIDVILECTGSPSAGVRHALLVRGCSTARSVPGIDMW